MRMFLSLKSGKISGKVLSFQINLNIKLLSGSLATLILDFNKNKQYGSIVRLDYGLAI